MYIFRNAVKNLIRNKGRNILMGVIILAIIATTVVSLIINNTSKGIIDNYKNRFGSEVTISPDMQKLIAKGPSGGDLAQVTPDMYLSFGKSGYLKSAQYSYSVPAISDSVHSIGEEELKNQPTGNLVISGNSSSTDATDAVRPELKLIATSSLDSLTEFKNGQRKLIDGKIYKEDNECIISSDLADKNSLKVGDSITIKNAMSPIKSSYNLKIAGIYKDITSEYGNMPFKDPFMNRRNEILTNLTTVMDSSNNAVEGISPEAKFILKAPKDLKAFEAEVRGKGLPDIYNVTTDEASYNKIVGPVEGMKALTMTFMIVVLILGGIILILLSSIAMRERKYEVGVLRAMGMKKGKVALGLLSEMLLITTLCLILGLGIGALAAQPVTNILLQNQVEAAKTKNETPGSGSFVTIAGGSSASFSTTTNSDTKALSEMKVGLDIDTLWQIVVISLILAALSSLVSINYITKYEPIKILSERS